MLDRGIAGYTMGLKEMKVYFENPFGTYEPGETVNGKVVVRTDSIKKIRGIIIFSVLALLKKHSN